MTDATPAVPASPWTERLPAVPSAREITALALLAEGATTERIARRLSLSPGTTANMLTRLYRAIGAVNATHAVALALRAGVIE